MSAGKIGNTSDSDGLASSAVLNVTDHRSKRNYVSKVLNARLSFVELCHGLAVFVSGGCLRRRENYERR